MSLVSVDGLSLAYGSKTIFKDASFAIAAGDRIGLLGPNGTGKSTLMRLLSRQLNPDAGEIRISRHAQLGYLPQDLAAGSDASIVETVLSSVPARSSLYQKQAELETELASASSDEERMELAAELSELHDELSDFEARFGRHRAEEILGGLGFLPAHFDKPVSQLSGGWRMRAHLAGLLLKSPDLLLLDEPTNHLDVPTLNWFDQFIGRSPKSLILICHDRDFLNRHVRRILALEPEGLVQFRGNCDGYRQHRAVEMEHRELQAQRQAARRAEVEGFAQRFGAKATKARQAQSRLRRLEQEEEVVLLKERDTVHFQFPEAPRSGRQICTARNIQKGFAGANVFSGLHFEVERGQKIAVIGPNGAGKSTLLKLLSGDLSADSGTLTWGENVTTGYYAQHQGEALDRSATLMEEVRKADTSAPDQTLRSVLGAFLFSSEDVSKRISVLSGGERARVALSKLLLIPTNLLLMDEPTNHLDLDSSERLIEALRAYDGTIIFVSHNRSFINQLATHIWEVRDKGIKAHPGNLDDYLYHLNSIGSSLAGEAPKPSAPLEKQSQKDRRRADAQVRAERSARIGPLQKKVASLEAEIAALESSVKDAEATLADGSVYSDFSKAKPLLEKLAEQKEQLASLMSQWETLSEQLATQEQLP
jgi:ATP-binding cassette subfamily F protein 3